MANAFYYSNTAQETTLSGSISAGATSITVGATVGFPGSFPYVLALDYGASGEELVSVTAAAGTSLTVSRGFSGTSAQTHSLGAKVRHVYHAGDATDFRTHEGAMGAVHGVAGTLVGTSDTQTLANKTLTAPAISGGSFAGTFTGTPTFSGAVVFSGGPAFNRGLSTDVAQSVTVTGDTFDRHRVYSDGLHEWGSGSAARDVRMYRAAADTLGLDDTFRVVRGAATDEAQQTRVTGDTASRHAVEASGKHWWGDGTNAPDTNLYRTATGALRTDGALTIIGNVAAANITTGTWTTYTPTWTASTTNPSLGNGTLIGKYALIGKTCHGHINLVTGSTTTYGSGTWSWALPVTSANDGTTRIGTAHLLSGGYRASGDIVISPNASTASIYFPAASDTRMAGASATYPITWSQTDQIRITFTYETA
ncbi:hypothetical protein ACWDWU_16855 [Streptomyces sp. NPDC003442]